MVHDEDYPADDLTTIVEDGLALPDVCEYDDDWWYSDDDDWWADDDDWADDDCEVISENELRDNWSWDDGVSPNERTNDRTNERPNERTNERPNERPTERTSE